MKRIVTIAVSMFIAACSLIALADEPVTVAVIGTGDMGNSLGPKLSEGGYRIIYGSRDPSRAELHELVIQTGNHATATMQKEAAHLAGVRACLIELQDFERLLDSRLPSGAEIIDDLIPNMLDRCTK